MDLGNGQPLTLNARLNPSKIFVCVLLVDRLLHAIQISPYRHGQGSVVTSPVGSAVRSMAKTFYSCDGLCIGRAGILWNCTLWPFVLLYVSMRAYLFPCCSVYLERLFALLYENLCSCCFKPFEDDFFGEKALGDTDNKPASQMAAECDWVRAGDIVKKDGKPQLFEGKIEPADLCQVILNLELSDVRSQSTANLPI
jgi:hypothetical protein